MRERRINLLDNILGIKKWSVISEKVIDVETQIHNLTRKKNCVSLLGYRPISTKIYMYFIGLENESK